jgi:cytochrome c oxidase subunit 2
MNFRTLGPKFGMFAGAAALAIGVSAARAQEAYGHAEPDQIGFQLPVTEVARDIQNLHTEVMWIITAITLFVLALLVYVVWKFNEKANPTPSRTTHHTGLEVAWTVVPILILVVIAIPSFRLLTKQLTVPKSDVTIKVTGKQWAWDYEYPADQGDFDFMSLIKSDKQLKPGDIRQLAVDNEAVVPVNKVIDLIVTADPTGVIHSFTVPSFGVRVDAVPGRLNQTWFKAEREGVYYGQCSKICGKDHAYMPIAIRVVSEDAYKAWLADAKKKFGAIAPPTEFASNESAAAR